MITLDKPAVMDWLQAGKALKEVATKYGIETANLGSQVRDIYTRCTNAAILFHSDESGELSHAGAARDAGVDLDIYNAFKINYGVIHSPSSDGLEHALSLKKSDLYERWEFDLSRIRVSSAQKAALMYFDRFATLNSIPLREAGVRNGIDGIEAELYVAYTPGLGMPETRECALKYKDRLLQIMSQPGK